MINTHKELVSEIKLFASKFEFINEFKYVKDVELLIDELLNSNSRVFLLGLEGVTFDESQYNMELTYRFAFSEEIMYNDDAVLTAETENMFCVSALGDYLNYLADTQITFSQLSNGVESDSEKTYCSTTGTFTFIIKRNASYWKKMEEYSV